MTYRITCPKCGKEQFRIHFSNCFEDTTIFLYGETIKAHVIGIELECDTPDCNASELFCNGYDVAIANDIGDENRALEDAPFKKGRFVLCFVPNREDLDDATDITKEIKEVKP